jgi:probable rRNA maturation factor
MSVTVDVQRALEEVSEFVPSTEQIRYWVSAALGAAQVAQADTAQLTVRIVDEAEITALNRDYRHKDKPTNVLSFPFEMPAGIPAGELEPELGDLVVCATVVAREAVEQGKLCEAHWAHMIVHGTLHLLGYDHLTDDEAQQMESLETQIVTGLGYADPYAADA